MASRSELIKKIEELLLQDPDTELKSIRYRTDPETVIMIFTTGEVIETEITGYSFVDLLWEIIDIAYA